MTQIEGKFVSDVIFAFSPFTFRQRLNRAQGYSKESVVSILPVRCMKGSSYNTRHMLPDKCVMGGFSTGGWVGETAKPMATEKVAGADTCSLVPPGDANSEAPQAQGDSNCRLSQSCVSNNEDKQ